MSRYHKGKTNLDFTEARDSEWQWHQLGHMQVCTSLQRDNHASTPPLSFFGDGFAGWRSFVPGRRPALTAHHAGRAAAGRRGRLRRRDPARRSRRRRGTRQTPPPSPPPRPVAGLPPPVFGGVRRSATERAAQEKPASLRQQVRLRCTNHASSGSVVRPRWLGSRVVSVLDSGAEGPGFKSQPRRCRVTVLGKLFTPIVPLFTKQRNC